MRRVVLFALLLISVLCKPLEELQEVDYGSTAILNCESNDPEHNFLFWQLPKEEGIIGPGNEYNKSKYEYEVLTGKLYIKSVSEKDEGVYKCVSKGVRNDDINVRTVRIVVKKDWEEVYEHDSTVHVFRIIVIVGSMIVIIGAFFVYYSGWKSRREPTDYLIPSDDEEEDSGEELFAGTPSTSTSTSKGNIVLHKQFSGVYDNQAMSTDFKSIMNEREKD